MLVTLTLADDVRVLDEFAIVMGTATLPSESRLRRRFSIPEKRDSPAKRCVLRAGMRKEALWSSATSL